MFVNHDNGNIRHRRRSDTGSNKSMEQTGLVVQDTGSYWSGFGQTVILILIQTGGLGVVTVAALHKRYFSSGKHKCSDSNCHYSRYFAMILGGGESGCPYFIQYLHFAMPGLTYREQKGTGLYLFQDMAIIYG